MKRKITKKDIFFFFIGMATVVLIDIIWDWDKYVRAFNDGYSESQRIESKN